MKYLVEKGATVDLKDFLDEIPLSWAAQNGREDVAKCLIEYGTAVDSNDSFSRTALSWTTT